MTEPPAIRRPSAICRGDLLIYLGPPLAELPPGWTQQDGVVYRRATAEDELDPRLRPCPPGGTA